jgi:hypothetical protein
LIDEVDKFTDNDSFVNFLSTLRKKYLDRNKEKTFKSVVLVGVYNIKNLKERIRTDECRIKTGGSPWNIAENFNVDMRFNHTEIASMLIEYESENDTRMDIEKVSSKIYDYTSGYPFLVSKICKIIDEDLNKNFNLNSIEEAIKLLLNETNTLFEDLINNIENDKEIYNLVYKVIVEFKKITYNASAHEKEIMLGILDDDRGVLKCHNQIFQIYIYNHMIARMEMTDEVVSSYSERDDFVYDGELNIEKVLLKFQDLMKAEYRDKDQRFIEREGRLLFLCFVKPIINGVGFYYVESEVRSNKRVDLIITYNKKEYIIELKIWHGDVSQEKAKEQLSTYLDIKNNKTGYLLVFNFNKDKEYVYEWSDYKDKRILYVEV